ncbi:MAG: deoxyribose-phosphate aldolase [Planctomycetota bacterium]|nr:deoxyribose-phosphate aldolase [Planctomycetota bacterium]
MDYQYDDIAKMIDHALLVPSLTDRALEEGCQLALEFDVASVCIMPYYTARCADILKGSTVLPSTTIGFPHGGHSASTKLIEAKRAIEDGCQELDMVVNISQVRSGHWSEVQQEIGSVVEAAHSADRKVKVIFENCYLTDEEKIRLCQICGAVNADWVKTSTGFGSGGATFEDLRLMRHHTPQHVQVKAAGGIRDMDALLEARAIGVTRIGSSRTAEILNACRQRLGLELLGDPATDTASGY